MKNILLIVSVIFTFCITPNVNILSQDHEIEIDRTQDKDSVYIMLSENQPGKYRQGRGKWTNYENWKGALMDSIRNEIADSIAASGGGGASYLVYTANLDFGPGGEPPTAIVLENTLGGTVVWAYEATGEYSATLAGMFPDETKVWISINYGGRTDSNKANLYTDGSDVMYMEHMNFSNSTLVDANSAAFYHLEIRVYP